MSARKEEWRDLPGYEGWYQVSDWGRICSFRDPHHKGQRLKTPVILNPTRGPYSTHIVIKWEGKQRTVQVGKAVALTFLGAIPKGWVAYHKDGNPENNALYAKYKAEADKKQQLHLLGRLAEYKYYNMDAIAARALELAERL